jgi:hypothetical protein
MIVGLLATMGLHARPGGGPGGHGGSGGHGGRGGFSSGRSSGPSSGSGVGHTIGHSFGRLFGRPNAPDMPIAGAAFVHGKVVQLPGPRIASSPAQRKFPHRHGFRFGGCGDFDFPRHRFLIYDNFNCSAGAFSFDP